jgi:hypothetical protein
MRKALKASNAIEGVTQTRAERAKFCTQWLQEYEKRMNWPDFADMLLEVERDKLYLEIGANSWDEWAQKYAPKSYVSCYTFKTLRKELNEVPIEILRKVPPETAKWFANSKNISPAMLKDPKIQEVMELPKQKAIAAAKKVAPDQHIETLSNCLLKFTESQKRAFDEAREAYKAFTGDATSREDFIEALCADFWESETPVGLNMREWWTAQQGGTIDQAKTQDSENVAAL